MEALYSFFPARAEWPDAIDDALAVSRRAQRLRLVSGAKNLNALTSYRELKALWCFDIGSEELGRICGCQSLEALHIENLKTDDISSLEKLPHLKVLSLNTCASVKSFEQLIRLSSLSSLALIHFKNVHHLEPLSRLSSLRSLAVAGSVWARMQVESFRPLENLKSLELLHLTNIKAQDESLKPLAALKNLKQLDIANFYPMSEFAALSSSLTTTTCTWFQPYQPFEHTNCKKCGSRNMLMLTGKGRPKLCKKCDRKRLERHVEDWNRIAAAA